MLLCVIAGLFWHISQYAHTQYSQICRCITMMITRLICARIPWRNVCAHTQYVQICRCITIMICYATNLRILGYIVVSQTWLHTVWCNIFANPVTYCGIHKMSAHDMMPQMYTYYDILQYVYICGIISQNIFARYLRMIWCHKCTHTVICLWYIGVSETFCARNILRTVWWGAIRPSPLKESSLSNTIILICVFIAHVWVVCMCRVG